MRLWILTGRYPNAPASQVIGAFSTGRKAIDYANSRGVVADGLMEWTVDMPEAGPTWIVDAQDPETELPG